jgi:hypothetical protein
MERARSRASLRSWGWAYFKQAEETGSFAWNGKHPGMLSKRRESYHSAYAQALASIAVFDCQDITAQNHRHSVKWITMPRHSFAGSETQTAHHSRSVVKDNFICHISTHRFLVNRQVKEQQQRQSAEYATHGVQRAPESQQTLRFG